MHPIQNILQQQKQGQKTGIYSCCSANDLVIRAAMQRGKAFHTPVLIEATANQVNQTGGYTGMTPADFFAYVHRIAEQMGFPAELLILGGDHLGPLTWAHLAEREAMPLAEELIREYVLAGFTKIHIDTSMPLQDDEGRLSDEVIADRGARLCKVAEEAYETRLREAPGALAPVYIIGSEVPIPGGAQEKEEGVEVTRPEACLSTYEAFHAAFMKLSLGEAWKRVVGLVVQPGVEFGDRDVFAYDHERARELCAILPQLPIVFEGHSTDYQTPQALRSMVEDGIAILKVGPALTFALREALFALELIEKELWGSSGRHLSNFRAVLEHCMLENEDNWKKHYHGDGNDTKYARAFSYSDRARYYLPAPEVQAAIKRLFGNLDCARIPESLIRQYFPMQLSRVQTGEIAAAPLELALDHIGNYIDDYLFACGVIKNI